MDSVNRKADMMLSVFDYKIIASPNNSLSKVGALRLFAGISLVALTIAMCFVSMGAWLVLPFAGLELAALAWAFYYVGVHSTDFESITIDADQVVVEKRDQNGLSSSVFHRYWVRVTLRELAGGRRVLCIGSHGKEVEFGGRFINDEQRVAVMREIKEKLKYTN